MLKDKIKKVIKVIFGIFITLLLVITLLAIFIYTGPRSVPFLAQYTSNYISRLLPEDTTCHISDLQLGLGKSYQLELIFDKITFLNKSLGEVGFSNIKILVDPLALFPQMHHTLFNVEISQPQIKVAQLLQETSSYGKIVPISQLNNYLSTHKETLLKFSITVKDTELTFDTGNNQSVKILVNSLSIMPELIKEHLVFSIYGDLNIGNKNNELSVTIDTNSTDHLTIEADISNISTATLAALGYQIPQLVNSHVEVDFSLLALLKSDMNFERVEFNISNLEGVFHKNDFFNHDIQPKKLEANGYCDLNCRNIFIEKFHFIAEDLNITGKLELSNINDNRYLIFDFILDKIPINRINEYWPKTIIPRTKSSMFEFIHEGFINKATGSFKLNLDEIMDKKNLNSSEINVNIDIEDTQIEYIVGAPPITKVNGVINITKDLIKFNATGGSLLQTSLSDTHGQIIDLAGDDCKIIVEGKMHGQLQDLVDVAYASAEIPNKKLHNLTGEASTSLKITIPIQEEDLTLKDIGLNITSGVLNASIPNIYKQHNITDGKFDINYNNHIAHVSGQAKIDDAFPVNIDILQDLLKNTSNIKVKGDFNWDEISKFGFTRPQFINNAAGFQLEIAEDSKQTKQIVEINLNKSSIDATNLGIKKPAGIAGNLRFVFQDSPNEIKITDYRLSLPNLLSEGSGIFKINSPDIIINSHKTVLGKSSFQFNYKNTNNNHQIKITGNSFDASVLAFAFSKPTPKSSESNSPFSISLEADLQKLYLKNNEEISLPKLKLFYEDGLPKNVDFKGKINQGNINLNIKYPTFSLISDDAGSLINGLDIKNKFNLGKLNLTGSFSNTNNGINFKGHIKMLDFNMKKTPVMAKLLSVASLTVISFEGVASLFSNEGVKFDKMHCPVTYSNGIIQLDECFMRGPVMAITGKGYIDIYKDYVKINGNLIPKNVLDTLIPNIPIIGNILAGQSIFGVTYVMEGSLSDPQIQSNPLSLLAPGFLKNLFN